MATLTGGFPKLNGNGSVWIAIGLWLVLGACIGKLAALLNDSFCGLGGALLRALSFDCVTEVLTGLTARAGVLVASFSWVGASGPVRLIVHAFCG